MRPPLRPPDDPNDPSEPVVRGQGDAAAAHTQGPGDVLARTVVAAAPPSDLLEITDPIPDVQPLDNPFGLSPQEFLFVEAFCGAARFRAITAYELAGFKVAGGQARANASRMLRRERVAKAITARLAARAGLLGIMDGDEALEGLSLLARSDIRKAFPETHWIAKLPDEIALCIKAITPTKHGHRIELYDKGHHLEVMAKVAGKLKETVKVEHTLEEIMAAANREPGAAA
jgi:hypothetical protein